MTEPNTPENTTNSPAKLSPCPVKKIHSPSLRGRILNGEKAKEPVNVEELKLEIGEWIEGYRKLDHCISIRNSQPTTCTCCQDIPSKGTTYFEFMVGFLWQFGLMSRERQLGFVVEWIKYVRMRDRLSIGIISRTDKIRCFILPGTAYNSCCRDTLIRLIGYGYEKWMSCEKIADGKKEATHGNKGNQAKVDPAVERKLNMFFYEVGQLAEPRATLFVRELVDGTLQKSLKNDDEEVMELPGAITKRSLYGRYLRDNGWKAKVSIKGTAKAEPLPGVEQKPVCSWSKFHDFWSKEYPRLVVGRTREDICGDCYVYANRHKFLVNVEKKNQQQEGDFSDSDDDDIPLCEMTSKERKRQEERTQVMEEQEQMLLDAADHVKDARKQREFYQLKKLEAKATKDKRPSERTICLVADYAQNMAVPSFAFEQPGETYYYSPLNAYCFGVVDCAIDKLFAFTYTEDIAKKGGNNVCSLLMKHFLMRGYMETEEPFKEVNLIFDNCAGQNKNRMVLRLLFFLVKLGVTKVARASFLVKGHTKNDCDRLFNVMKKGYRKSNIYVPSDLLDSMQHDLVEAIWCSADQFYDWDSFENSHMYKPSKVKQHHCFTYDIDVNNGETLVKKSTHESKKKASQKILRPEFRGKDKAFWKKQWMDCIKEMEPVGIQDIKWKELYDKWAPLIPVEAKQHLLYYREDPGEERRAKIKANTDKAKAARRERTTTKTT